MKGQQFLPAFPEGAVRIGKSALSLLTKDGTVNDFIGADNYHSHKESDTASRRYIPASLMEHKHVRPRDFGKNISAVARAVALNQSTLRKAVKRGAVQKTSSPFHPETDQGSTKTQQSRADAEASNGMGTAC